MTDLALRSKDKAVGHAHQPDGLAVSSPMESCLWQTTVSGTVTVTFPPIPIRTVTDTYNP
jgi:hypothetical protein